MQQCNKMFTFVVEFGVVFLCLCLLLSYRLSRFVFRDLLSLKNDNDYKICH